jgi:glyoxylate reductase
MNMVRRPLIVALDDQPEGIRELMLGLKPEGFDLWFFGGDASDLQEKLSAADYVLVERDPLTAGQIAISKNLKLIQKCGRGMEGIDVPAAHRRGIPLCCTSGANSQATAELAVALMLAVYRRLCDVHSALKDGRWLKFEVRLTSHELHGKTVGLLGIGNVGRSVARIAGAGFGCNVLYNSHRRLGPEVEEELHMAYLPMDELLRRSDIVSLHLPLTPKTRGSIGARELALMRATSVLINTSRGPIVDEPALADALRRGTIAAAGLDVFEKEPPEPDNPLLKLDNVVLSAHCGGGTLETMTRVFQRAFRNIQRVERGEPLPEEDVIRA